jgi:iron complex outermembrane receptor protein
MLKNLKIKIFTLLIFTLTFSFTILGCGGGGGGGGAGEQPGSISGTVTLEGMTDYSGAKVEIKNINKSATTASNGSYEIKDIPPGTYTVIASKEFYEEKEEQAIIKSGENIIKNFNLKFKQAPHLPAKK